MIEPRLRASMDICGSSDESGSDELSESISLSSSEVFLPHVLGPETFEMDFYTHRRQLAPRAPSPQVTTRLQAPSEMSSTTTICQAMGRFSPPCVRKWFRRPYDPEFLVHLLDLYFYWIHPSYEIFSRDRFLRDFQSGITDNCSRILANAIAAFACRYSDHVAALADPDDPSTAGDQFFAEAQRLLQYGGESPWMLSRALSVMSSRELACGRTFTSHLYAERCQGMEYQHPPCSMSATAGSLGGGYETRPEISQPDQRHMPGCW
jgi:hypothetical protein